MKFLLIPVLFCLSFFSCSSNSHAEDVSGAVLRLEHFRLLFGASSDMSEKVVLADSMARICMDAGRPEQALHWWQEKAGLLEQLGSFHHAYYTWKFLAQGLEFGRFPLSGNRSVKPGAMPSLLEQGRGGERSMETKDSLLQDAYIHMVSDAMQAGLNREGMEAAYGFFHRWPEAGREQKASVLSNLGSLYMYAGRMEDSYACHRQALELLPLAKETEVLVYRNLAGWFFAAGQMDSSLAYLLKIRPLVAGSAVLNLDFYYNNLACLYSALGQEDMATRYFGMALDAVDKEGGKSFRKTRILVNMSNMCRNVGDWKQAESYLQESIALSREIGYKEVEYQAHLHLASLLAETGDSAGAYKEMDLAYRQRDSVRNSENEEAVYNIRKDFELEKLHADLQSAELNNVKKKLSVTILAFVTFFLLIAMSVLLYRLKREKEESGEALRELSRKADDLQKDVEAESHRALSGSVDSTYKDGILHSVQEELVKLEAAIPKASREELEKDCGRILRLVQSGCAEDRWKTFIAGFEASYPHFFSHLEQEVPGLTRSEKRLAALLAAGLNAKEIASMIHRTPRSVGTFIYRLRKKAGVPADMKTPDYFGNLKKDSR